MNGRDLAGRLLSRHPHLKLLYMSGYTANVIARHGVLDHGLNFLQKPFSKHELDAKVRQALEDAPSRPQDRPLERQ
jgi:FixJ family two-component response regulator